MREDLNKQLCERERHGSGYHFGETRKMRVIDDSINDSQDEYDPSETAYAGGQSNKFREGMKTRHDWNWNQKTFNEHLSPLYGNIRKAVGRKWNDFFSELNNVFDTRSVVNRHILLHLYDRIDVDNVYVDHDGELMVRSKYSQRCSPLKDEGSEFYVDPRDGIIKFNRQYKSYETKKRERAAQDAADQLKVRRVVDDLTELRLIDGIWFEVKFEHKKPVSRNGVRTARYMSTYSSRNLPKHTIPEVSWIYPLTYDVVLKKSDYYTKPAISKRTLSHKELKRHQLI